MTPPTKKFLSQWRTDLIVKWWLFEYTCLCSKPYSFKFKTDLKQSAKGIQEVVKNLQHDLFTEILSSWYKVERCVAESVSAVSNYGDSNQQSCLEFFRRKTFNWKVEIKASPTVIIYSPIQVLDSLSSPSKLVVWKVYEVGSPFTRAPARSMSAPTTIWTRWKRHDLVHHRTRNLQKTRTMFTCFNFW